MDWGIKMAIQTDIPAHQVGRVVQNFVDEGKTNITVKKQFDGLYTVETE